MKLKFLILFSILMSQYLYACNNNIIKSYVDKNNGEITQIFATERINVNSSIFFYYFRGNDDHPDLKASYAPDRCKPELNITFDVFSYDGGMANIESVFWGKGRYKENLFVIVSWVYNLDGARTVGKYYSVFSYDYNEKNVTKNDNLTSLFESGKDGFDEGMEVRYKFKTAKDVWDYLKNNT